MNGLIEWGIFLALSAVAIITAACMIITMSMYRAGLALMASFVALAGLFILLNADLLAAIQVMMNVGGMLVMVLFMVMIMMDPGGEMMWGMKRDMHMPRGKPPEDKQPEQQTQEQDWTCPMHPEISASMAGRCPKCGMALMLRVQAADEDTKQHAQNGDTTTIYTCPMHPEVQQDQPGTCPKCGMTLVEQTSTDQMNEPMMEHDMSTMSMSDEHHETHEKKQSDHTMDSSDHDTHMSGMSMTPRQNYDMMVDMAMSTAQLPAALVLGVISALLLMVLVIFTPWPLAPIQPTQDATTAVGQLLLSRYMIGFEGAAFLILAGIAGAVLLAKRERPAVSSNEEPSTEGKASEMDMTDMASTMDTHVYTCPMHPEVRQDGPGTCPTCGMNLQLIEETLASSEQSGQSTQGGRA